MYSDLVESKGLGLVRADITPNLTKKVRNGFIYWLIIDTDWLSISISVSLMGTSVTLKVGSLVHSTVLKELVGLNRMVVITALVVSYKVLHFWTGFQT